MRRVTDAAVRIHPFSELSAGVRCGADEEDRPLSPPLFVRGTTLTPIRVTVLAIPYSLLT